MKKKVHVFILLSAIVVFMMTTTNCTKEVDVIHEIHDTTFVFPDSIVVKVGALLDLTGDYSITGRQIEGALQIRTNDLNDLLIGLSSTTKLELITEDVGSNPANALEKIKKLNEQGIDMVIGPNTSSALENIIEYLNENRIVTISPTSIAPSLASPDYVFRFAPNAYKQGKAVSALLSSDSIKAMMIIARDEIYGVEMKEIVSEDFENNGGVLEWDTVYNTITPDFGVIMQQLDNKLIELLSRYNPEEIGIFLISFDEAVEIFEAASEYENLKTINWYGNAGNVQNEEVTSNTTAYEFASSVNFIAPTYGENDESDLDDMVKVRVSALTGIQNVNMAAVFAYDALNVLFMSYTRAASQSTFELVQILPVYSKSLYGASGWGELDVNGDRIYSNYDFWSVQNNTWEKTAVFIISPQYPNGLLIRL